MFLHQKTAFGVSKEIKAKRKREESEQRYRRLLEPNIAVILYRDIAEPVFQTFSRLNAKRKYVKTGLRGSLRRKIAERHGGKIMSQGQLGVGVSFCSCPFSNNACLSYAESSHTA